MSKVFTYTLILATKHTKCTRKKNVRSGTRTHNFVYNECKIIFSTPMNDKKTDMIDK